MTPTTRSAAKAALMKAYPGRSIAIHIVDWHHHGNETPNQVGYTVSVLPGPDGSKCMQWSGQSLAEAVSRALAYETWEPPTEDLLDRQFAENEMADPNYAPTLDEALKDPAGFVAGMREF